jgi:hypothetical protein
MSKRFWLQKQGNIPEEYEDACCHKQSTKPDIFRVAIADGATDASFSGIWATLLVDAYCQGQFNEENKLRQHLSHLQTEWHKVATAKPLPWYAEKKLREGTFSSLLGLTLTENTWEIMVIGDSCFFHISEDSLKECIPLTHSEQFNNSPILLSSHLTDHDLKNITKEQGVWQKGDEFYLMTDALASWFLQEDEQNHKPWNIICQHIDNFKSWITELRETDLIHNDDVTLLHIIAK